MSREASARWRDRNRETLRAKWRERMANKPRSYKIWLAMRTRCNNPNFWAYNLYGGRGIKVCERWDSYAAFASDMGEPADGMTLDRINPDLGYSPDNCRWATRLEQSRNRRDAWLTEHIAQWIWYMRYYLRWRVQDIANFFGKPVSTVGNCLYSKTWNPPALRIGKVAA